MKGFGIFYKKMRLYCKKIFFKNFRANFRKITYLHKNACSSFIINSRIVIRISDERAWHPLQKNEVIFSKNIYIFQFSMEFLKNYILAFYFGVISSRRIFCISVERDWCPLQENWILFPKNRMSKNLDGIFKEMYIFLTHSSLLMVK